MGIPHGHDRYITKWLSKFLTDLDNDEVQHLISIEKIHHKWEILKQSLSARITHLLRNLTPKIIRDNDFVGRYQNILKTFLADIVRVTPRTIEDHSFLIAQLRTLNGGGGLGFSHDVSLAGFVASITVSLRQIIQAYPHLALIIEK